MKRFASALFPRKRAFRFQWRPNGLIVFAIGLVVFLNGCTRRQPRADLVLINGAEPQSLDPAIVSGQPDGRASGSLFEGLLQFDAQTGEPVPAIAERFDISPDALTYTFYIRSNALWSTGEPITAEDFVWSWRRALAPETAADYAGQLFYIQNAEAYCTGQTNPATGQRYKANDVGVKALNDRTLEVKLVAPTPFFPDLCAFRTLMVVPRKAIEKYGDRWVRAADTPFSGAFMLESWRVNDRIRVKKNPNYWNAANVQVNTVDFLPQHEPNFCLNVFLQGDADLIFDKRRMPSELLDAFKDKPYFHRFEVLATFFYRCNVTRPPFDNPLVRKALGMAVDRQRIVERITRGGEKIASAITPPGTRGYQAPEGLSYNPEVARKLLEQAGYPGGKDFPVFRYLMPNTVQSAQIAVELREMWQKELGVRMEIQQLEWKVYLREQSATNFDLSYSSWIGDYNDPNTFLDMFMSRNGNNRTGWSNARYDALMREGNAQVDKQKRAALLRQAETILVHDDAPIVPLYFEKGINMYRPDEIGGIWGNAIDEHPIHTMYRKKPPGKARAKLSPALQPLASREHAR
jgi:oligopeptide transport system substrate-binding protein